MAKQPTRRSGAADIHARVFQLDNDVAEVGRRWNEQIHFALFGRRLHPFDLVKFIHPVARLRAACLHARTHPLEFFTQEALAASFGLLGDLPSHGLRFEKRGVISRMRKRAALVDLDDACGDHIEEVAVVRHEDDCAGKTFQIVLEPADRFGIEVVRWFVEQKQIRLAGQSAAQRNAAFFTTRKRADRDLERWRAKRGGCCLDARVEVPAIGVIDQVQQLGKLGFRALAIFISTHGIDDVGCAGRDVFMHAQFRIELELLWQITDTQRAAQRDVAGVGLVLPGEDFQQRSFAASVAADHADFFAGGDSERDAIEQRLVAIGEADFVGGQQSGHWTGGV